MNGRKLAYALGAIALLAFVLPPLAARQVNARRIGQARQDVMRIAGALAGDRHVVLMDAIASSGGGPVVLAGPGVPPKFGPGFGWPEARIFPRSAVFNGAPDPWGNQYLVAVASGRGGSVAVLSSGPNGTVETPFGSARAPRGDDVAAGR